MRDVSAKYHTLRTAKAAATLGVSPRTIRAIRSGNLPKADPLAVARIAGIQAAKNTSMAIPYCHQVPLDSARVDIALARDRIEIITEVKAVWKTGVEMEALHAASVTALTLYDMLKIIDDGMEIRSIGLVEKKGGKSQMSVNGKGRSAAVLVMSDTVSAGLKEDRSGRILVDRLKLLAFSVKSYEVVPDNRALIERKLAQLADRRGVDLILTTGGTGMSPRDVTPEATLAVITRRMEGVEEAMRSFGQERIPMAMLSRGVAGVRGSTLIVNFPGSPGGVEDGMNALFPALAHVFRILKGKGHSEGRGVGRRG